MGVAETKRRGAKLRIAAVEIRDYRYLSISDNAAYTLIYLRTSGTASMSVFIQLLCCPALSLAFALLSLPYLSLFSACLLLSPGNAINLHALRLVTCLDGAGYLLSAWQANNFVGLKTLAELVTRRDLDLWTDYVQSWLRRKVFFTAAAVAIKLTNSSSICNNNNKGNRNSSNIRLSLRLS